MKCQNMSEAIAWSYRLFLDREVESSAALESKLHHKSTQSLRRDFMNSPEFRQKNPDVFQATMSGNEPAMRIDDVQSQSQLDLLFEHIQKTWQHLGETEPHWSVLTLEHFLKENLESNCADFYASGKADLETLFDPLARNGIDPTSFSSCLEYGCGVGRVTHWLAGRFDKVHAFDISRAHLDCIEQFLRDENIHNVGLHHLVSPTDISNFPSTDLIYSVIVLQHNPPPIIRTVIREMIRSLNTDGVAYFQLPTYNSEYSFDLQKYLEETDQHQEMEMHVLPQKEVFSIIHEENGRVLEVVEDRWTGWSGLSNTFTVQKMA